MNKRKMTSLLATAALVLTSTGVLQAQFGDVQQDADRKPALMILGTYHMAPTSSNVINVDVDDVTAPVRQQQLRELVTRLRDFRPAKIALECDFQDQAAYLERYRAFLAGNHELRRSEIEQIGFRLAKAMGHDAVYCIDWGVFPDDPLYNYETYAREHPELDEYLSGLYADNQAKAEHSAREIASRSIVENLIAFNQAERAEKEHRRYFQFLRIGRGDEYVGANYVSWWYGRNLKIFANIVRLTRSPDDRILVVYGAGHNKLLNQFSSESGFFTVQSPLKYLEQ